MIHWLSLILYRFRFYSMLLLIQPSRGRLGGCGIATLQPPAVQYPHRLRPRHNSSHALAPILSHPLPGLLRAEKAERSDGFVPSTASQVTSWRGGLRQQWQPTGSSYMSCTIVMHGDDPLVLWQLTFSCTNFCIFIFRFSPYCYHSGIHIMTNADTKTRWNLWLKFQLDSASRQQDTMSIYCI